MDRSKTNAPFAQLNMVADDMKEVTDVGNTEELWKRSEEDKMGYV
jgi:hypothetical protein